MTEIQEYQLLVENAMILMSRDMFSKIYELPNIEGYVVTTDIIKHWAREFVKQLNWKGESDTRNFEEELKVYEDKMFNKIK